MQRTPVPFPARTRQLTTIHNSSYRRPSILCRPLRASGMQMVHKWAEYSYMQNKNSARILCERPRIVSKRVLLFSQLHRQSHEHMSRALPQESSVHGTWQPEVVAQRLQWAAAEGTAAERTVVCIQDHRRQDKEDALLRGRKNGSCADRQEWTAATAVIL